jgi:hypothetical protein
LSSYLVRLRRGIIRADRKKAQARKKPPSSNGPLCKHGTVIAKSKKEKKNLQFFLVFCSLWSVAGAIADFMGAGSMGVVQKDPGVIAELKNRLYVSRNPSRLKERQTIVDAFKELQTRSGTIRFRSLDKQALMSSLAGGGPRRTLTTCTIESQRAGAPPRSDELVRKGSRVSTAASWESEAHRAKPRRETLAVSNRGRLASWPCVVAAVREQGLSRPCRVAAVWRRGRTGAGIHITVLI